MCNSDEQSRYLLALYGSYQRTLKLSYEVYGEAAYKGVRISEKLSGNESRPNVR